MSATAVAPIFTTLPAEGRAAHGVLALPARVLGHAARHLHSRWIYHATLADLEGYSERLLADIGAGEGIDDFARRAARL